MASRTRRIAIASVFGATVAVVLGFLPAPTSDYLIGIDACLLALGYLLVGRGGGTYVGVVGGLIISVLKFSFFPLSLLLASLFGVLVDGLLIGFRAKVGNRARVGRIVVATTLSTGIVGFTAYYVTVVATRIIQTNAFLNFSILGFGLGSGAAAGWVAARIWNRFLAKRFPS